MTPAVLLACAATACVAIQLWLLAREISFQADWRSRPPAFPEEGLDEHDRSKAADYAGARLWLGGAGVVVDGAVLLVWSLGGGLFWLDAAWSRLLPPGTATAVAVLVSAVLVQAAAHRGLSAIRQFAVEQRFGFGRTTVALFVKDSLIKGSLLLAAALGLGTLCVALLESFGTSGWWGVWLAWTALAVLQRWLYPITVGRLLNRYADLPDRDLAAAVARLMSAAGSRLDRIVIMDGSRRSSHGNAHVAGLGGARRVVLLDTLLEMLTPDEILGVVAHEAGHLKHRHVATFAITQAGTAAIWIVGGGQMLTESGILAEFNIPADSAGAMLALIWSLTPVCAIAARPFVSGLVRRFEFQADRFAVSLGLGTALDSALRKLHRCNATAEDSDPFYAAVYLSHPTLRQRLQRLSRR